MHPRSDGAPAGMPDLYWASALREWLGGFGTSTAPEGRHKVILTKVRQPNVVYTREWLRDNLWCAVDKRRFVADRQVQFMAIRLLAWFGGSNESPLGPNP
ncbi:hypothetical protein H9P43_004190 [Blastocladiella emersonii ATCC 22665]|nr:hypothetical protein H9P43_004190 [Blastocladiella emersonii ATCC 22665]